ncbi:MAG: acetyltransferase [Anditalea sp.]
MYIFGASGHARTIIDIIDSFETIHGIFDDNPAIKKVLGYPVLGKIPSDFELDQDFFIAIGDNRIRKRIAGDLRGKVEFAAIVHPSAIVSKRCQIEKGSVIMEGAIVKVNSNIGKQVIINTGASVDHDCTLGDFVHIAPQATLCGDITIGEGTLVGANALILPRIKIGAWCTIGAGSVVSKDVPDGETWVGHGLKANA